MSRWSRQVRPVCGLDMILVITSTFIHNLRPSNAIRREKKFLPRLPNYVAYTVTCSNLGPSHSTSLINFWYNSGLRIQLMNIHPDLRRPGWLREAIAFAESLYLKMSRLLILLLSIDLCKFFDSLKTIANYSHWFNEHLDCYAAQNCEKSKFILQPRHVRDSLEVFYTEFPCNTSSHHPYYYRFCEESGWGNEEATVACRELGYLYGTACEYINHHT